MCIIVSKEKGVALPSKATLERCFKYNRDGAGLMFTNKGKVNIVKGFMNFKDFYEYLMKLDKIHNFKEKALVMHFRISTGGNVDGGNCHPYPISSNEKDLRKTYISTELGMAHNGIISMYNKKHSVLNDTQMFIKECVSTIFDMDKEFVRNNNVMRLLEDIAGSKLCFLDKDENIYYVGKFIEENGVKYSNTTYKDWAYTYYYPTTYTKNKDTKKYYYDEIVSEKKNNNKSLSKEEFNVCLQELEFLNKGTEVVYYTESGSVKWKQVPCDNKYAIDNFFNLYEVDWKNYDIVLISEDVDIIDAIDLDTEDVDNTEVDMANLI